MSTTTSRPTRPRPAPGADPGPRGPRDLVVPVVLGVTVVGLQTAESVGDLHHPVVVLGVPAVLCVMVWWVHSSGRGRPGARGRRALCAAGAVLAAGLFVDAITALTSGPLPEHAGFLVASCLTAALVHRAVEEWGRVVSHAGDPRRWANGIAGTGVVIGAGLMLVEAIGLPAVAWPAWQQVVWLAQIVFGLIVLSAWVPMTIRGGTWRGADGWLVSSTIVGHVVAQLAVAPAGFDATARAAALSQVVVGAALVVATTRTLPTATAPATRGSATWTLLVLSGAGGVLAVAAVLHPPESHHSAALVTSVAALVAATQMVGVVRTLESSARSRAEARTDDLTGLANRRGLLDAVRDAEAGARTSTALVVLSLRRFKDVNDRFGPAVGDEVLRTVASRVAEAVGDRGDVARLSGDELAVVLPRLARIDPVALAGELVDVVGRPVAVGQGTARVGANAGVARPDLPMRPDELLRRANVALYAARRADREVVLYDPAADREERRTRRLAEQLGALLAGGTWSRDDLGRLVLHYQPQLDATTGAVVGAEALVRWEHPEHGLVPPAGFIELAESHGLMGPLSAFVLRESVRQSAAWAAAGRPLRVSVNLSSTSFRDVDLVRQVSDVLAGHRLSAELLALELTETVMLAGEAECGEVLEALRQIGVELSIDDFGTGYSSLSYLANLPVHEVKVDRSFVRRLLADDRTRVVVARTIDLAHDLGLRVVTEGVEDAATLTALRELGCDVTQGYLHSRPLSPDALDAWLDARPPLG